ncbi:unnamed protein product [Ranitomeya imitator]|uniref:Aminopeptidase N n=1 Tax=Ranitomeya imitator TaxID=111125 RepID=A0ABN9L725_9NEOB|nr:unnamed protein product [Ranitomeya imitator]
MVRDSPCAEAGTRPLTQWTASVVIASRDTTHKRIQDMGYKCRIACVKPLMTNRQCKKRLTSAKEEKNWTVAQWFKNELFMMHNLINIFEKDTRASARAVSVKEEEINNVELIDPLFDFFSYNKAAALIRMASTFLTETLFLKGISSYLKKFAFSNADQDGLWNHLQMFIDDQDEVKLPVPLKNIMDSWTWKKGMPLVTLNTSTGMLSQGMLNIGNHENITNDSNHTWIIPISWMKNGVRQPSIWLDSKTKSVPEMKTANDDEWIILNIDVTSYYKTNYDVKNWNSIAKKLEEDIGPFPVVNRVQIMDDAFILANAGYMEYETTLNLTRYLEKETEILKYILKRMNPIFQHYGSIVRRDFDETADDIFVHTGINEIFKTACFLGLKNCLDLASDLYAKWMANTSTNEIPQSIKGSVYCYGIAEGGQEEWEFAWNYYNKSDSEDHWELTSLKQGLSCTREPWLLYSNMKDSNHFYEMLLPDLGLKATSELQFQEGCHSCLLNVVTFKRAMKAPVIVCGHF